MLLAIGMLTSAIGWLASTTVKLALPPASEVARPATGVTAIPVASSSVFVTATSAASIPLQTGSLLTAGAVMIE